MFHEQNSKSNSSRSSNNNKLDTPLSHQDNEISKRNDDNQSRFSFSGTKKRGAYVKFIKMIKGHIAISSPTLNRFNSLIIFPNIDEPIINKNHHRHKYRSNIKRINLFGNSEISKADSKSSNWMEETRSYFIAKFKKAKEIIIKLQNEYIKNVTMSIEQNNIVLIRNLMLNEDKKKFYKKQLLSSSFLSDMLINNRIEILQEVLQDPFFVFDNTFIFDYLTKKLHHQTSDIIEINNLREILKNVIQFNFFKVSLIKVFGWFICCFGFFDLFQLLVSKNLKEYELELAEFNNFNGDGDIFNYLDNKDDYNNSILTCLQDNLQSLAIELLKYNKTLECDEIINTAVAANSKTFLKFIWEENNKERNAHHSTIEPIQVSYLQNLFSSTKKQTTTFIEHKHHIGLPVIKLTTLIEKIGEYSAFAFRLEIISTWKHLNKEPDLMKCLFKLKAYDEIEVLLFRYPNIHHWKFSPENFRQVIADGQLDLSLQFLKDNNCKKILEEPEIQAKIVEKYFSSGASMYYGSEMLNHIHKVVWDTQLTFELIEKIDFLIKRKEILYCHSPILTCLLLAEIISNICDTSIHFKTSVERVRNFLLNFCKTLHESNSDERYIKYLFTQKDTKFRSAYQITADTQAFTTLESPEIGTIIRKMWEGRLNHDGILSYSSLKRYWDNPRSKGLSPFLNFSVPDLTKPYFHQYTLWMESCSLRYISEIFSKVILIILYNIYIYWLVTNDAIMSPFSTIPFNIQICLILSIVINGGNCLNIPLQFIYFYFIGKRKYSLTSWNVLNGLSLVFSLLLFVDINNLFNATSDGVSDVYFLMRGILLCINDILVWVRITENFLTFKELGPLLSMILSLAQITAKYLVIYLILLICCATIFTTIFYDSARQFMNYTTTFTTLFDGFLSNSNCFEFDSYQFFGAIMITLFVTISGLMLINLLIALLSNEYVRLSKKVDATHRSVLISYFLQYKWNKDYGFLIAIPETLNYINLIILPIFIGFFRKNHKQFNIVVSKAYFAMFYFPFIVIIQLSLSLIFLPICYFIGIFFECEAQSNDKELRLINKIGNVLKWIIMGLPFIIWNYIKDIGFLFRTIFMSIDMEQYELEKKRIKQFIQPDDIRNFLQFIHKRDKRKARDLHTLFIDFLDFEFTKRTEKDKTLKNKEEYVQKLRTLNNDQPISFHISFYNKTTDMNREDDNGISVKFMKRNLIIIEILENFLIDDGSENFIVDIEKLKMLLPKTMNINNSYIKRLVHTDISSLTRAINKFKNKTNAFLQQKMLNKIVGSTVRLNKIVDLQNNTDPLRSDEERRLNNFELDENEDDFYSTLEDLLRKMSNDLSDNIKTLESNMMISKEEKN